MAFDMENPQKSVLIARDCMCQLTIQLYPKTLIEGTLELAILTWFGGVVECRLVDRGPRNHEFFIKSMIV